MQTQTITYVRSFTNPNQFYLVAAGGDGLLHCDCKAAQFNRKSPCKHVRAVAKDGAGLVATPKAAPVAARPQPSPSMRDFAASLEV